MICPGQIGAVDSGVDIATNADISELSSKFIQCQHCGRRHAIHAAHFEGQEKPRARWNALDVDRDFSAELGVLVAEFAIIESYLPHLMTCISGVEYHLAYVVLGHFQSINARVDLLKALIGKRLEMNDTSPNSAEKLNKIKELLIEFKRCIELRNKYLHAGYGVGAGGLMHVRPFPADARKAKRTEIKGHKEILLDVETVKDVNEAFHRFIFVERNLGAAPV
jgi:hypothetical protein